jgi:hypothetical protein
MDPLPKRHPVSGEGTGHQAPGTRSTTREARLRASDRIAETEHRQPASGEGTGHQAPGTRSKASGIRPESGNRKPNAGIRCPASDTMLMTSGRSHALRMNEVHTRVAHPPAAEGTVPTWTVPDARRMSAASAATRAGTAPRLEPPRSRSPRRGSHQARSPSRRRNRRPEARSAQGIARRARRP